jgi:hypothetical protein
MRMSPSVTRPSLANREAFGFSIRVSVPSFGAHPPQSRLISLSYAHLPWIEDLSKFDGSLALRMRVPDEPQEGGSHSRSFTSLSHLSKIIALGSVVVTFAISADFASTSAKQQAHDADHFTARCEICGDRSSVTIICPATGSGLTVSTRDNGCGHIFVGQVPAARGREAATFVTNPGFGNPCPYAAGHLR